MKKALQPVAELVLKSQGIDISMYEESFLEKSIQKRIIETTCDSEESYCNYINDNLLEGENFLNCLHVSYSEFFRNPLTFSVLEQIILPSIVLNNAKSGKKEIRIWSAACASGQETYSLAMLLNELKDSNGEKINYRIFATDQSEEQVKLAKAGVYASFELENLKLKKLNRWFDKTHDSYVIKEELKQNIEFSVFDLFNDQHNCPPSSIFGDFDIVICANLLFYYKPEFRNKIINKTRGSLTVDGYLITGETERSIVLASDFHEVYPFSAIYRKL